MASSTPISSSADWVDLLPAVQLNVRQGSAHAATYVLDDMDFLIGSVAGCDLRLAAADNAGVLCLLARHPAGAYRCASSPNRRLCSSMVRASRITSSLTAIDSRSG